MKRNAPRTKTVVDERSVPTTDSDDRYIGIIRLELADIRASDDRADRKAQILFGFTGATLALTISVARQWTGGSAVNNVAVILAYGSVLSFAGASFLLGLAVRPQLQSSAARASWIRLVMEPRTGEQVRQLILSETPAEKIARLAQLAYELAVRARRKHRRIQWALLALLTGAVLLGTAAIIHR